MYFQCCFFHAFKHVLITWILIQFSHSVVSESLQPHELQHARPPLSITNSQSLPILKSIESVMPSSHLILCHPFSCPQSLPAPGSFQMSQFFESGGQNTGVSAPALTLPMNFRTDFLRMDWLDLLVVQGTRKCLLQHHNSRASIL